jgi:hypothetical protein
LPLPHRQNPTHQRHGMINRRYRRVLKEVVDIVQSL